MSATLVVVGATLLAATAQTVAGFGFALIAVPLFVLVLDVPGAVGTAALLSFVNVVNVARTVRSHAPWDIVRPVLVGSLCGMPLGLALLLGVSSDALRIAVGSVSILMAAAIGLGFTIAAPGRLGAASVGLVSGVLSTSIAINGPPVVLYLQALRTTPEVFRAAISTFFTLNGVVTLSLFVGSGVIDGDTVSVSLPALPALLLGNWLGHQILPRFRPVTFHRFVLLLLVLSAGISLVEALFRVLG